MKFPVESNNEEENMTEQAIFQGWCILELLGHRKVAGYVTEAEIAGVRFLKCSLPPPARGSAELCPTDVQYSPDERVPVEINVQYYSAQSVYCITPVSEHTAMECADRWLSPYAIVTNEYPQ